MHALNIARTTASTFSRITFSSNKEESNRSRGIDLGFAINDGNESEDCSVKVKLVV